MNRHVIIPAAGMGSRLGLNMPKAAVKIEGKPIIQWQLEMIGKETPVTVIVGYGGDIVGEIIEDLKMPNVLVKMNSLYDKTTVVDSIICGIRYFGEEVVILDGDVLIGKEDLQYFIKSDKWLIGTRYKSGLADPVYINENCVQCMVTGFSRRESKLKNKYGDMRTREWACVCAINSFVFKEGDKYIYRSLERVLPMRSTVVDSTEVDTKKDVKKAEKWIRNCFTMI